MIQREEKINIDEEVVVLFRIGSHSDLKNKIYILFFFICNIFSILSFQTNVT